jgi:putative redox protein
MKTKSIKCSFENSRGFLLDARLDIPADIDSASLKNFIIVCHCFTCSKETITTYRLSRLLAELGYGVLRFDFTGLGNSEGDFSASTFSTTQDDLKSAINFLKDNYRAPAFLMGHSLGGTTALSVAQDYDFIKAVVTIASPSQPDHVLHHFGHALTLLEQDITASFEVAGQYFDIKPGFVDNVRSFNMQSDLSRLAKPVLIFNIENDALVDEQNAKEIQQWVKGETELITVKNTDHLLSDRQSSANVARQIAEWLKTKA